MPELPEVETVKRELGEKILGKKIKAVFVNNAKVIKQPAVSGFRKGLTGASIKDIFRKGKALILALSGGKFLVIHLRMSGWFSYGSREDKARVIFQLSGGKYLNFMNQRLLGELRLVDDWEKLKFIRSLGPDPLRLNLKEFRRIIGEKRRRPVKVLLMDQHLIAGVGNIYAQEALFLSGIHPERTADSLSEKETGLLHKKLIAVLKQGIKYRGSSVDSYRNTQGDKGGMENKLKVYGRKNEPCYICGNPVRKVILGGRGTCFCEFCQR